MLKSLTTIMAIAAMILISQTTNVRAQGICDGLTGAAAGLCNAYCVAMDCTGNPQASALACSKVQQKFEDATGGDVPPCVDALVDCPCFTSDQIVNNFVSDPGAMPPVVLTIKDCSLNVELPFINAASDRTTAACPSSIDTDADGLANHFAKVFLTATPEFKCAFNHPFCADIVQPAGSLSAAVLAACRFDIRQAGVEICSPAN